MSINIGMDKEEVACNNGMLLSHKKEWNNAIHSNMDGETRALSEVSQTKANIAYTWNLKKKGYK